MIAFAWLTAQSPTRKKLRALIKQRDLKAKFCTIGVECNS
ncbi:hypothetical protein [Streptococcus phage smHBZ8]|nr:hypothetical protein [Streptococcus phage smHBZ8]